jgi:uncharacterized protein YdaU (DUF1376 family)
MSRAWMPIYWGDYLRDTRDLTTLQHGAYLLLIAHYWQHNGLPADEKRLAAIAGLSPAMWKTNRDAVADKFQESWKHKRIDDEIEKAERKWMQRSQAGQRGGQRSGVARSIKRRSELKAETKRTLPPRLIETQSETNSPRTNHQVSITSSETVATREEPESLEGSLATALPEGALREPSRVSAKPEASSELKRLVASKWGVTPPAEPEAIPPFLRRTS